MCPSVVSFRDCKALLVTSLTHVSGTIASVQTYTFTFSSVISTAQYFIIVISASDHLPLRTIKCSSVVFGETLKLFVKTNSVAHQRLVSSTRWSVAAKYCTSRSHHALEPTTGSESRFLPTTPAFDAPVKGFPSECCHPVWYGKTRMTWLPDGEKILKIRLFVLTQFTNVTDTQTDRQTDTA